MSEKRIPIGHRDTTHPRETWEQWSAKLVRMPDGTWYNTDCIEDESFFAALDEIRRRPSRSPEREEELRRLFDDLDSEGKDE